MDEITDLQNKLKELAEKYEALLARTNGTPMLGACCISPPGAGLPSDEQIAKTQAMHMGNIFRK